MDSKQEFTSPKSLDRCKNQHNRHSVRESTIPHPFLLQGRAKAHVEAHIHATIHAIAGRHRAGRAPNPPPRGHRGLIHHQPVVPGRHRARRTTAPGRADLLLKGGREGLFCVENTPCAPPRRPRHLFPWATRWVTAGILAATSRARVLLFCAASEARVLLPVRCIDCK